MAHMILYCAESPNLKLGPGTIDPVDTTWLPGGTPASPPNQVLVFFKGFAEFDTERFPDWEKWVKHPGTPYISIEGSSTDLAEVGEGFPCEICAGTRTPRWFATKQKLSGHMLQHRRKGELV